MIYDNVSLININVSRGFHCRRRQPHILQHCQLNISLCQTKVQKCKRAFSLYTRCYCFITGSKRFYHHTQCYIQPISHHRLILQLGRHRALQSSHQHKSDTKYEHSDNESHFNKPNCLLMACVHKTLTVIGDNVIATTVSLNHGKWLCYMTYCSKLLIYV